MSLEETVGVLVEQLREVHHTDDQKLIIRNALIDAVGDKKADVIIVSMPWRATTGWKQLLHLIKHGYLGYPPVTDTVKVAKLTGAPIEAVSRVLVTV